MDEWLKLLLTAVGSAGLSQMVTFFVARRDKGVVDNEARHDALETVRTESQKAQDELGASVAAMLRAELKAQFDNMTGRIRELEADNRNARIASQELYDGMVKRIKVLENENSLLHEEGDLLRRGQRDLTEKNDVAVREAARLNEELVKRDVQIGTLTGQITVLSHQISERDTTIMALRGRVAELEEKVRTL